MSSPLEGTASSQGILGSAACNQVHKGLLASGSAPFTQLYLNSNNVSQVLPINLLSKNNYKYGLVESFRV